MAGTKVSIPKGTAPYQKMIAAFRKAGASAFCAACYNHVTTEHTCVDWLLFGEMFGLARYIAAPVKVTLAGGLEAEEIDAESVNAEDTEMAEAEMAAEAV